MWGAFWRGGRSQLVVLLEYVNGAVYRETLNQHVLPLVHVLGDPQRDWLFQDDNALPHRAQIVTDFKLANGIRTLNWPAISPDMNPIEHVWDEIKRRVYRAAQVPTTLRQLEVSVRQQWDNFPQEFLDYLIGSMNRRVRALLEANGGHTRY